MYIYGVGQSWTTGTVRSNDACHASLFLYDLLTVIVELLGHILVISPRSCDLAWSSIRGSIGTLHLKVRLFLF